MIHQYFGKKQFDPETNILHTTTVELTREETPEEQLAFEKAKFWGSCATWVIGLGALIFICGSVIAVTLLSIGIAILLIIAYAVGFSFVIYATSSKSYKWDEKLDRLTSGTFSYESFGEPYFELKKHNEEQEAIAAAWRAEHPFEEYIRKAIENPKSSVIIAEAAKYYAENFLKKE